MGMVTAGLWGCVAAGPSGGGWHGGIACGPAKIAEEHREMKANLLSLYEFICLDFCSKSENKSILLWRAENITRSSGNDVLIAR